jgi:uncharacterized small protein (DUF1192 family)
MRDEDETRPQGTAAHRVGEPLDMLSVEELGARIALLKGEIARLEAARDAKKAALESASAFFRT